MHVQLHTQFLLSAVASTSTSVLTLLLFTYITSVIYNDNVWVNMQQNAHRYRGHMSSARAGTNSHPLQLSTTYPRGVRD